MVRFLLVLINYIVYYVSCSLYPVSFNLYPVFYILYPVSCILYSTQLNNLLMELPSGTNFQLVQPSNHPINKPSNHPTVWQPAIQHSGNQPSNSLATNHIISLQTIFFNPTIQPFATYTFNRLATTPTNLFFTKSSNKLASNHPTV